jgi:hypothetical protein
LLDGYLSKAARSGHSAVIAATATRPQASATVISSPCLAFGRAMGTVTLAFEVTAALQTTRTSMEGRSKRVLASLRVMATGIVPGLRPSDASASVAGCQGIVRSVRKPLLSGPIDRKTDSHCSIGTCPQGPSWFTAPSITNVVHSQWAVCSNAGICDRATGECQCYSPFTGDACDLRT